MAMQCKHCVAVSFFIIHLLLYLYAVMSREKVLLFIIIVFYVCNGMYSIKHWSVTADEGSHLDYAIRLLKRQPERIRPEVDNSKMPISILNALPRATQQFFNSSLVKQDNGASDIFNGRYITLLFSVATILLVFVWTKKLYGRNAGLLAALLMAICPNNLSAAVLVTTDAYASFFLLATLYTLWLYCANKTNKHLLLFACTLAMAQLAKQSLFHLYIVCAAIAVVYAWARQEKFLLGRMVKNIAIVGVVSWLVINAGFLFYKIFIPLGDYNFSSSLFLNVQQLLPSWLPVPFSKAFVTGLDMAKYYDQLGGGLTGNPESSFANVTILNQSSTGGSFWYYYVVSIFYKTPIAYFILFGWAVYFFIVKKLGKGFFANEWFLLLPVLYYLLLMSLLYKTQCGIRHIIFIYPLLFIFCSSVMQYVNYKKTKIVLCGVLVYLLLSVLWFYKNYYAYTNEFCINKTLAYNKVGASNINFNQGDKYLQDYLLQHPQVQYAPVTPATGTFVIMLDEYMDIWNTKRFAWLQQYQPVGTVANGCYLVLHVAQLP
jgi:4-amino-4-deoxy-L-arabinose transferase-like glycosyltransferase